ncbi:hypothetical protein D3C71_1022890 [compost metagenome]
MRHLGKIGYDRLAADRLAERHGELRLAALKVLRTDHLAQIDHLAGPVRQFDADRVATRNDSDTRGDRAHRAGDVVRQANDAGRLDTWRGLQFVKRHDRAGAHMDDLALDAKVLQHAFQHAGVLFQRIGRKRCITCNGLRLGEQMDRRKLETVRTNKRALRIARDACTGLRRGSCRRDTCRTATSLRCTRCQERSVVIILVIGKNAGRTAGDVVHVEWRIIIVVMAVDRRSGNYPARIAGNPFTSAVERRLRPARVATGSLCPYGLVQLAELVLVEIVRLVVSLARTRLHAHHTAQTGLGNVPIMRGKAERQEAFKEPAVILLFVFLVAPRARDDGRNRLVVVFLFHIQLERITDKTGGEQHQPDAGNGEDAAQHHSDHAGRIGADKQCRKPQDHVADNAADTVRDRPCLRRGKTAERSRSQQRSTAPGGDTRRNAIETTAGDQRQRKGKHRQKRDEPGKAEKLHHQVGKGRTAETEKIGGGIIGSVGKARVGDIPGGKRRNGKRKAQENTEADQRKRLPEHERAEN